MKVGFSAAQGTGKTTAVYELAALLKKHGTGHDVYVISEVARKCPFLINEKTTIKAQEWIMTKMIQEELEAKAEIIIHDRTLLDSWIYGLRIAPDYFERLRPYVHNYLCGYDIIFVLPPNDKYLTNDGTRSTNKKFRDEIDNLMQAEIKQLPSQVNVIRGGVPWANLEKVLAIMSTGS